MENGPAVSYRPSGFSVKKVDGDQCKIGSAVLTCPGVAPIPGPQDGSEVAHSDPVQWITEFYVEQLFFSSALLLRPGLPSISGGQQCSEASAHPTPLMIREVDAEEGHVLTGLLPRPGPSSIGGVEDVPVVPDHPGLLRVEGEEIVVHPAAEEALVGEETP